MSDIFYQNNLQSLLDTNMFNPMQSNMLLCEESIYSFKDWPKQLRQKPDDLSKSGFFYTGFADKMICFYCDPTLRDWDVDDNIQSEHYKWSPQCLYLKMCSDNSDSCQLYSKRVYTYEN